jgi:hypothetical protein
MGCFAMNQNLTTQIVYDDNDIRIVWQNGSTDFLLMTFGDFNTPANGHRYFADTLAHKAGITTLGVMAKRGNWYPKRSMEAAGNKILPLIKDHATRIGYGGSMGGYAALKFSRLLGATHVIALCPQWSIDKAECDGVDPGWQSYFHLGMRGMGIRAEDVAGQVFLFSDSFDDLELFHSRKIIEACPGARFINVPMVSHHVTEVFAGNDDLSALLNACTTLNLNALHRLSRQMRKDHATRRTGVIGAALRRIPETGFRTLLKHARQDIEYVRPHESYIHEILAYIARTEPAQEAVKFYYQCRSLLDPVEQIKACAQITRTGDASLCIETTHDTVLVYDVKQNKCIHRQASANEFESHVKIEMFGQYAALYVVSSEVKMYLASGSQTSLCVPAPGSVQTHPFNFEIEGAPNGNFSLKFANFYLCAEKNGALFCNRPSADAWEHFAIGAYVHPTRLPDSAISKIR